LFTTDRNHNDSYLSNSPRAIQTNFQHSRARQKYFSPGSSCHNDQRNNTGTRNTFVSVGRQAEQISTPFHPPPKPITPLHLLPSAAPRLPAPSNSVLFTTKPVILTPFRPHSPLIPARILLQRSRLLLNWKYFDDIVGCGFHARELGHPGPRQQRKKPPRTAVSSRNVAASV
jgi:hypothetical protein